MRLDSVAVSLTNFGLKRIVPMHFQIISLTDDKKKIVSKAQKIKFSMMDFSRHLQIWSYLLEKSMMENFIFCAVETPTSSPYSMLITSLAVHYVSALLDIVFSGLTKY